MFHTLDDYKDKNRDEKAEKDKRKTTDSYTGGKSSGIAVENPEEDDWMKKLKKYDNKEQFSKTKNKIRLIRYTVNSEKKMIQQIKNLWKK